jgi:small subunit ribosomal protein S6
MSATQGNFREYETIFILRPDSTDQIQDTVRTRIEGVMEKLEGRLLKYDNWGKRKLAFDIRDRTG